ncbi:putative sugar epimerase YhfK [Sulfitobacter sp. THAF37]|uniref:SDR family oxidoreductase n=1 Tax=Sulfitobacter sp. THAF37 TaxID=2587855 RepID=UPI001268770D|nr:SDR family oxidoreductase [Sulfitobacter sp. THAF37]QFT57369.1 putative sugar epimerase YhfK [Sulfitobacter sp. THAF37]
MKHKVLVAGATGKTGRLLFRDLIDLGADPIALVRDASDTQVLPEGATTRSGDLTDLPDDVCAEIDTVVFAAGSGGDTGADMTDKVDRLGAKRLVDLAEKNGVQRFVMLSSIGADAPPADHPLKHYLEAKHDADQHLQASSLTHAILRPVALTDDPRSGNVVLGREVDPQAKASRADVAFTLARAAVTGSCDGQSLSMQSAADAPFQAA